MELTLIKYLFFIIGMTIALGGLSLWLKSNKVKRKQQDKKDEQLEIQKALHRQMLIKKEKEENSLSK